MKKLSSILKGIQYSGTVDDRLIHSISYDSRKTKNKSLFVAIKGLQYDGHKFIIDAIKLGATAIIVDEINSETKHKISNINSSIAILRVKNTRQVMALINNHH